MINHPPKVSLGIPVYNGENYLSVCLESLLGQTFTDFEIIIVDNASTDRTAEICQEFAQQDDRIRYHRNSTNIGPIRNFDRAFQLATGTYFKWCAHDDLCAPEFLEKCVEILDADPNVSLCYSKMKVINEAGEITETYSYPLPLDHPKVEKRFQTAICVDHRRHSAVEIFGLMRRGTMAEIPPQGLYARGDSVYLARVALAGRFHEINEYLFFNRDHGDRGSRGAAISARSRTRMAKVLGVGPLPPTEWFDPSRIGTFTFPEWNLVREYWISMKIVPLKKSDQLKCCKSYGIWLLGHVPKLSRDVLIAGEMMLQRVSLRSDNVSAIQARSAVK
jgi:glycosyltransferase involved in cell wall biosynthesis